MSNKQDTSKKPTVNELRKQLAVAEKVNAAHQKQVGELQQELADADKLIAARDEVIKKLQEDGKAIITARDVAVAKLSELEASLACEPTADEVVEITDPVEVRLKAAHPQSSYVRCGIQFTKETLVLSLADIGEATLQRLNDDIYLDVQLQPTTKDKV